MPLAGKRVGLISAWASRLGGGVFEAVIAQARLIKALGGEPQVFALADAFSDEDAGRLGTTDVKTFAVRGPAQIGYAPGLGAALERAALDCLHLQGIWMYPSHAASRWAARTGRGFIISPHGMLDPWITGRGRWTKALARTGYERASWRRASFFHASALAEVADIAAETGRGDSIVIANAGPPAQPPPRAGRPPHIVYIGRIHRKKNLVALVEAWRGMPRPDGAQLTLAGWGEPEDEAALRAAVAAAGPSVRFVAPVYGADKQALLETARFWVLPSHSEGLPMSMLDAWAAGLPTVMTARCNLPEGFAAGAALECGTTPAAIAAALERAVTIDDRAWLAMADAAHRLASGHFSAATIAAQWAEAYGRAIANGSNP